MANQLEHESKNGSAIKVIKKLTKDAKKQKGCWLGNKKRHRSESLRNRSLSKTTESGKVFLIGDRGLPWQEFLSMNPKEIF
jgi:hypothetical protein